MANFLTFYKRNFNPKIDELVFSLIYRAVLNKPTDPDDDALSNRMLVDLFSKDSDFKLDSLRLLDLANIYPHQSKLPFLIG